MLAASGFRPGSTRFAKNGLEPAAFWAYLAASAELGSGVLLFLGLLTPLVAAILIGDVLVAIFEVHATKGLWSQNGGFEYNLVLIVILVSIGFMGPGMYSLDRRMPALPRPYAFIGALLATLAFVASQWFHNILSSADSDSVC